MIFQDILGTLMEQERENFRGYNLCGEAIEGGASEFLKIRHQGTRKLDVSSTYGLLTGQKTYQ